MPSFFYAAYGLSISSQIALPELPCASGDGQESSRVTVMRGAPLEGGNTESRPYVKRDAALLEWPEVGRFTLWSGSRVLVEARSTASEEMVRDFVLGPVLATLLFQRGFLVLHASAVALPEARGGLGAVAFLGRSGEGKSTLAASLNRRGHAIVADDYIALPPLSAPAPEESPSQVLASVLSGLGHLRLLPPSVEALELQGEMEASPLRKRRYTPSHHLCGQQVPLRCLYVLGRGDRVSISPLAPAQSAAEVARHAYCTSLMSPSDARDQFRCCATLASAVPVRLLQRPRDLRLLSQLAQAVEDDARQQVAWA